MHEPSRVQSGEGRAHFFEFLFRAVDFQAGHRGHREGLLDLGVDIREVGERGIPIELAFAAEGFIAVQREVVVEAALLPWRSDS